MRWLKFLPLVFFFLLATSVPFAKQWRQDAIGGAKGGIEGLVMDQAGMPIAQARVQACNTMYGGCTSTISEPSGSYRIDGLVAGRYSIWAEARMHTSEWTPVIIVEEGQMTRHDIQLRREIPTMTIQPTTMP
jgi:Carboxypeptidase regulatory-like domain